MSNILQSYTEQELKRHLNVEFYDRVSTRGNLVRMIWTIDHDTDHMLIYHMNSQVSLWTKDETLLILVKEPYEPNALDPIINHLV